MTGRNMMIGIGNRLARPASLLATGAQAHGGGRRGGVAARRRTRGRWRLQRAGSMMWLSVEVMLCFGGRHMAGVGGSRHGGHAAEIHYGYEDVVSAAITDYAQLSVLHIITTRPTPAPTDGDPISGAAAAAAFRNLNGLTWRLANGER